MRIAVACVIVLASLQIPAQAAEQDGASTMGIDCKTAASTPAEARSKWHDARWSRPSDAG
jgi:hypothetical protein